MLVIIKGEIAVLPVHRPCEPRDTIEAGGLSQPRRHEDTDARQLVADGQNRRSGRRGVFRTVKPFQKEASIQNR
jgi:hypothetical protein